MVGCLLDVTRPWQNSYPIANCAGKAKLHHCISIKDKNNYAFQTDEQHGQTLNFDKTPVNWSWRYTAFECLVHFSYANTVCVKRYNTLLNVEMNKFRSL